MSSSLIARMTCWETKSVRQVPQNAVWWRGMPITALFEHLRQRICPLSPGHHWPDLDAIIVSKRIIFGDQIVAPNNQNTLRQQRQLLQQIFDTLRSWNVQLTNRMVE